MDNNPSPIQPYIGWAKTEYKIQDKFPCPGKTYTRTYSIMRGDARGPTRPPRLYITADGACDGLVSVSHLSLYIQWSNPSQSRLTICNCVADKLSWGTVVMLWVSSSSAHPNLDPHCVLSIIISSRAVKHFLPQPYHCIVFWTPFGERA